MGNSRAKRSTAASSPSNGNCPDRCASASERRYATTVLGVAQLPGRLMVMLEATAVD